jgi:hypothetical protein
MRWSARSHRGAAGFRACSLALPLAGPPPLPPCEPLPRARRPRRAVARRARVEQRCAAPHHSLGVPEPPLREPERRYLHGQAHL